MAIKKANPSWIDVKAKLADFDRFSLFGLALTSMSLASPSALSEARRPDLRVIQGGAEDHRR